VVDLSGDVRVLEERLIGVGLDTVRAQKLGEDLEVRVVEQEVLVEAAVECPKCSLLGVKDLPASECGLSDLT